MNKNPKITIVIPTLNASIYIYKCLRSIFSQKYPSKSLEVIIVDNYSTDNTLNISRKFPVKIRMNKIIDAQASKMAALKIATGDYFIYLDADIELVGHDWFQKMLKPLLENNQIVGSFTRVKSQASDSPITRYLTYDQFQRDPIFQYLSPTVKSTIVKSKYGYQICKYSLDRIPPTGLCLFRRKSLLEVWNNPKDNKFMELDNLVRLVKAGYIYFAYVPDAQFHHPFLNSLGDLLRKRLKHIRKNYLNQQTPREYLWIDLRTNMGKLKILIWVIYANLIIPATIKGIYNCIRYKDIVCLYEPIVTFLETWIIIYGFIRYSLKFKK